jgi:hypothetical protein
VVRITKITKTPLLQVCVPHTSLAADAVTAFTYDDHTEGQNLYNNVSNLCYGNKSLPQNRKPLYVSTHRKVAQYLQKMQIFLQKTNKINHF